MRNVTKRVTNKKMAVAVPALVAAGFSAWMGAPAAKGDFTVTVTQPDTNVSTAANIDGGYYGPPTVDGGFGAIAVGGVTYLDYVVSALNLTGGSVPTGSTLLTMDVTVTTAGSGTTGALYVAPFAPTKHPTFISYNPTDGATDPNGDLLGYGYSYDGTFGGLPTGALGTFVPGTTSVLPTSKQTVDHVFDSGGNTAQAQDLDFTYPGPDANYTNGTVHTLEVVTNLLAGGALPDTAAPLPFFNVVIPMGAATTIYAQLSGDNGTVVPYTLYINASAPVSGPTISLTGAQVGPNQIGPVLIAGGGGNYVPKVVAVPMADQQIGSLGVAGFNPSSDEEVYGLAITNTSAETLAQIAADLQTALTTPANGTIQTVASLAAGPLKSLLQNDADQLVAIFPTGSNPNASPTNFFSYNLSNYNGSVAITSITVVPEPTGIGALVLGGVGLLSRRKARRVVA